MATQQFTINPILCGGANGTPTRNGFSVTLTAAATVTTVVMSFVEGTQPPAYDYMLMWATKPPTQQNSNIGGWAQQTPLIQGTNVSFPIKPGQTLYFVPGYISQANEPSNAWQYYQPVLVTQVPPTGGITNTVTCNPITTGDSTQIIITVVNAGGGL